jgi:hypothetical protein
LEISHPAWCEGFIALEDMLSPASA